MDWEAFADSLAQELALAPDCWSLRAATCLPPKVRWVESTSEQERGLVRQKPPAEVASLSLVAAG